MTLSTANIAAGIAALTVTGVTIKDIDEIPDGILGRDCPILYPHPDSFVQGGAGAGDEGLETFGTPTTRFWLFNRTYRYMYAHDIAGAGRGLKDHYPDMCANLDAILEALVEMDVSGIDVQSVTTGAFGLMTDPSGTQFYGFALDIVVREKVNP